MESNTSFKMLSEEVSDLLLPTMSTVNGGYDENVHHLIDASFVEIFSNLIVSIILPILTGIFSCHLYEIIKQRGGSKVKLVIIDGDMYVEGEKKISGNSFITDEEIERVLKENTAELELLATSPINESKTEEAINALTELLISNGWPKLIAKINANKIVNNIKNKHH